MIIDINNVGIGTDNLKWYSDHIVELGIKGDVVDSGIQEIQIEKYDPYLQTLQGLKGDILNKGIQGIEWVKKELIDTDNLSYLNEITTKNTLNEREEEKLWQ